MKPNNALQPKLTICAVGSAQSTHIINRVKCFAERGHQVYLISDSMADFEQVTVLVPVDKPIKGLSALFKFIDILATRIFKKSIILRVQIIYQLYNFLQLLKEHKPDIVHVHYAYNLWGWMAAAANHHPLVVSIMGGDILFEEQGNPTPRGKWLTLQLLDSADLITSKSDYLTSVLDKLGGYGSKAIRVVWGVDLKLFRRVDAAKLRLQLGLAPEDKVILSPKILRPFYNVHLIVEAMPQIVSKCSGVKLLITEYAADPQYKQQIVTLIETLNLQKYVIFIGHIPHQDMPSYYSLADVTVAVPSSDGLPQTLLEGMACQVPNILSKLPRYEEFVAHEQSAYFVESTPPAIAEGVIRILNDNELRNKIICDGLKVVRKEADFDKEVSRVEAKYYQLLATSRKRANPLKQARVFLEVFRYFFQS